MLFVERKRIVDLAAKHRLPSIYNAKEFVELGGLIGYGASIAALMRRAAAYVDKILKGAKPRDLPVEQPTKFELAINLKTAKTLGLTIRRRCSCRRTRSSSSARWPASPDPRRPLGSRATVLVQAGALVRIMAFG